MLHLHPAVHLSIQSCSVALVSLYAHTMLGAGADPGGGGGGGGRGNKIGG